MRALCIRQPYASLIVHGFKSYETRASDTPFRGRFAVVATKPKSRTEAQAVTDKVIEAHVRDGGDRVDMAVMWQQTRKMPWGVITDLPLGIIGTVNLSDTRPVETLLSSLTEREYEAGVYTAGRWAWALRDPLLCAVKPQVGRQFWFTVDDALIDYLPPSRQGNR